MPRSVTLPHDEAAAIVHDGRPALVAIPPVTWPFGERAEGAPLP
jgi:hypothetical protein